MVRRISLVCALGAVLAVLHCQSYEDSFNRNIDSTGLYVVNSGSNTVSQFGADPKSGVLNELGSVAAGTTPVYITLNAAGTFAYVVNSASNDVYVFKVDKTTRKLSFQSSVSTGTTPRMIAFHRSGSYAYVVNQGSNNISSYSVDSSTGALTSLVAATPAGGTPIALVMFLEFIDIAVSNVAELRRFNVTAATGGIAADGTPAAALAAKPASISMFATSASVARLYVPTANNQIESFATSGWSAGPLTAQIATGTTPVYVAINPSGNHAFASNYDAGTISVYTVSAGNLTATTTVTACTNPGQIHANAAGFAYVACRGENKVNAYKVGSGSLSLIGSYGTDSTPVSVAGY